MWAFASTQGSATIRADARSFLEGFRRRIEAGLLGGHPHRRSRYAVTRVGMDALEFRAEDWLTAFNVGLNEVEITVTTPGRVDYHVCYPRWARSAVGLSAAFGITFAIFLLAFDLRTYLAGQSDLSTLLLSPEQGVAVAWAMAIFWGAIWPWILIALHKRPLRGLMDRLIAEVDRDAVQHASHEAR